MLMRADPFEALSAYGSADDDERALQDYERALALFDDLERYVPCVYPPRPFELDGCTDAASVRLRIFDEHGEPTRTATVFGTFRARVTELEAISAGRLEVLLGTLRKLDQLEARCADEPTLRILRSTEQRMLYHLRSFWQMDAPAKHVPLRDFCVRVVREYKLLPADWRHL